MKENDIIKDRYQLQRPLGSGGFGEVWLAKDMKTHTHCALKFYVRLDDKGREEFSSEYSRMMGIHHPNLLTASYYDEWEGRPFLVMDYCGGGAASGKVGQMDETELWRLIRDVASGLACLHSQRNAQGKEAPVIHQDIKPANFLQKDDGTWLVSDFGISSRMRSSMSSQSGREVSSGGTIPYMGPERFGQNKMLVKSSDIWALGASIYEMATRDLPFDEYGGILQKKGEEVPHLPRERWSSDLDRLVSSCLQKETWDRPSAELVSEYADCKLKGKPLPRLPHEELPPLPPPPPPKPWKWIAAAGAVVAVVLAIVLWPKPPVDPDTQAYKACKTVADYRAYLRDYGDTAKHYVEAKKFIDLYVDDSIKPMQQALLQQQDEAETQAAQSSDIGGANGHEYVDLGLPSGTLWATCNIGASKPEDYGDYYAWGEISTKNTYDWSTYKHANGDSPTHSFGNGGSNKLTKYCSKSYRGDNGFADTLTMLQSSDDPANGWGNGWNTPTEKQWNELLENTTKKWTTLNNVKGRLFTSKKNGRTIFLPAGGEWGKELDGNGEYGHYWSRTLCSDDPSYALFLRFRAGYCGICVGHRFEGLNVRPVFQSQSQQQIDSRTVLDETVQNDAEVQAQAETEKKKKAELEQAQTSSQTNTSSVSHTGSTKGHEWVDLGLPSGTLWATCNIGASNPEDYGNYYAWGETKTKSTYNWSTYKYGSTYKSTFGDHNELMKYCDKSGYGNTDDLTTLQTGDDPAMVNWGGGWRMPTKAQWEELLANTPNQWTTKNGVKGRLFTGKNGQTLFLPAAGGRLDNETNYVGSYGRYWSGSLGTDDPRNAWGLYFYSDDCGMNSVTRYDGFSVRPVHEK